MRAVVLHDHGGPEVLSIEEVDDPVAGPGEIVGVDNGDPTSLESFLATDRAAFNGLALVIIRSLPGQPGEFELRASSENLPDATVKLSAGPEAT